MQDFFAWRVEYRDGTTLSEADADAQGGAWGLVDATAVRALILDPLMGNVAHKLVIVPEGATAVFFRRRAIPVLTVQSATPSTVTCIGWRMDDRASYLWVWDGGDVAMTDRDLYDL